MGATTTRIGIATYERSSNRVARKGASDSMDYIRKEVAAGAIEGP